jgi:hypothetical protein
MIVMDDGVDAPYQGIFAVTPANSTLPGGVCKGVWCGTPGTINGIDETGNVFTGFPLQLGENRIRLLQISTGGTAANLWSLH